MRIVNRYTGMLAGLALAATATTSHACSPYGYMATVNVFAGNFAIRDCAFTNGTLLQISSYSALFSLLGTTYGGDGRTTFGLPDTRGRAVIGVGNGPGLSSINLGQKGGAQTVTLNQLHLPSHTHGATTTVNATATAHALDDDGDTDSPNGASWAVLNREDSYSSEAPDVTMHAGSVMVTASASTTLGNTGGSQAFSVRDPFIGMYWLIQTEGLYPSRN